MITSTTNHEAYTEIEIYLHHAKCDLRKTGFRENMKEKNRVTNMNDIKISKL